MINVINQEKVKACLDRIRVVRSMDHGQISEDVLQNILDLHDLADEEKEGVLAEVDKRSIRILIDDSLPVRTKKKETVLVSEEEHQARLTQALESNMQALNHEDGSIIKRYMEEIPVFEEFIRKQAYEDKGPPYQTIIEAMVKLSRYRVRRIRGWTCATGMSDTKFYLSKWLQFVFSEAKIKDFIHRCKQHREPDEEYLQIVFLLIRNVPTTVVHPFKKEPAVFLTAEKIKQLEESHDETN